MALVRHNGEDMTHPDRFLLAGVMGFPVMHSRSPRLHNYWLAQHGLAGAYLPLAIKAEGLRPDFARDGLVPFVDVAATRDPQNGQVCLLMLNRDLSAERELVVEWREMAPSRVLACETLTGPDLKATNTFGEPMRVAPRPLEPPRAGPTTTFRLPARSYSVFHVATS